MDASGLYSKKMRRVAPEKEEAPAAAATTDQSATAARTRNVLRKISRVMPSPLPAIEHMLVPHMDCLEEMDEDEAEGTRSMILRWAIFQHHHQDLGFTPFCTQGDDAGGTCPWRVHQLPHCHGGF